MLQYYTIPQSTMMKEQQQESNEMHTIQIFRDAPLRFPMLSSNQGFQQSPEIITTSALISSTPTEITDGISDWPVEMDEDVTEMERPSTPLDRLLNRAIHSQESPQEVESSLYSFYFETPLVSMGQDSTSDDYTITSHDTESDLDLDGIDDIWEQGLYHPSQSNPSSQ